MKKLLAIIIAAAMLVTAFGMTAAAQTHSGMAYVNQLAPDDIIESGTLVQGVGSSFNVYLDGELAQSGYGWMNQNGTYKVSSIGENGGTLELYLVSASIESANVSYNVDPTYTVAIPASVELGDENVPADITASDVLLEKGKQVEVKLTEASNTESGSTFNAKNGDSVVTYTITGDKAIAVGDTVATFTENGSKTLTFTVADKTGVTVAGSHTETLTFTISMEEKKTYLSTLTADYEAQDGDVLTGTLSGNKKITVAAGATITLKDLNITSLSSDNSAKYAGITTLGDATIILKGTNAVKGGYEDYPGIYAAAGATLTIKGDGSLTATTGGGYYKYGCGIGGAYGKACGNIVIESGTITATGGSKATGIGSGKGASCGDITISGGTVFAYGGTESAGIGSGYQASCGNITITGGTVNAYGGESGAGIGSGKQAGCGNITISGGTITANGGSYGAGIGTGDNTASCGNITIQDTVTKVTATTVEDDSDSIGKGWTECSCGTVTIGGTEYPNGISDSTYVYEP